jgi:hypothetical protein
LEEGFIVGATAVEGVDTGFGVWRLAGSSVCTTGETFGKPGTLCAIMLLAKHVGPIQTRSVFPSKIWKILSC